MSDRYVVMFVESDGDSNYVQEDIFVAPNTQNAIDYVQKYYDTNDNVVVGLFKEVEYK